MLKERYEVDPRINFYLAKETSGFVRNEES
jgi:hypothetical protein